MRNTKQEMSNNITYCKQAATKAALASSTINSLSQAIYEANKEKGFWPKDKDRNIGEALMLITSELSEALEADRKARRANYPAYEDVFESIADEMKDPYGDLAHECAFKAHIKDTFEDELADAVIRLLDLCGGLGINIGRHIYLKVAFNATRPHRHGKAY